MKNFKYIGSHNTIRSRMHEPISFITRVLVNRIKVNND